MYIGIMTFISNLCEGIQLIIEIITDKEESRKSKIILTMIMIILLIISAKLWLDI